MPIEPLTQQQSWVRGRKAFLPSLSFGITFGICVYVRDSYEFQYSYVRDCYVRDVYVVPSISLSLEWVLESSADIKMASKFRYKLSGRVVRSVSDKEEPFYESDTSSIGSRSNLPHDAGPPDSGRLRNDIFPELRMSKKKMLLKHINYIHNSDKRR
jgi:hypothetical protein